MGFHLPTIKFVHRTKINPLIGNHKMYDDDDGCCIVFNIKNSFNNSKKKTKKIVVYFVTNGNKRDSATQLTSQLVADILIPNSYTFRGFK